MMASDLKDFC